MASMHPATRTEVSEHDVTDLAGNETWKPIPGYQGFYDVSDQGRVRTWHNFHGGRRTTPRICKAQPGSRRAPYPRLVLTLEGSQRLWHVHRLVLLAFIGPPPLGQEVRHLDGDPQNNHLENLTYGTHSENERDKIAHGRHWQSVKTHCPQNHPYNDENTLRRPDGARRCRICQTASNRARYRVAS